MDKFLKAGSIGGTLCSNGAPVAIWIDGVLAITARPLGPLADKTLQKLLKAVKDKGDAGPELFVVSPNIMELLDTAPEYYTVVDDGIVDIISDRVVCSRYEL